MESDDCINDKFCCNICDYNTSHRGHWKKHINTEKHKMRAVFFIKSKMSLKVTTPYSQHVCHCGKQYSHSTGLYRHKQTCKFLDSCLEKVNTGNFWGSKSENASLKSRNAKNPQNSGSGDDSPNREQDNGGSTFKNTIVIDKKTYELMEEISKLKDNMISVLREKPSIVATGHNTTINANHNTLNINVYLDQNYAEAMNLEDFVQNIKCSVDDLSVTASQGYVKGVSNIFLRNLEDMDPKSRPIHCGDHKGTQIYIRDANKWEKDGGKLNTGIDNVAKKQINLISEWEQEHPDWHKNEQLTHQYLNLVRQLTAVDKDGGNEQIRKNVAKTVVLPDIIDASN